MTPEQYAELAVLGVAVSAADPIIDVIRKQLEFENSGRAAEVKRVAKLFRRAMNQAKREAKQ